MMSGINNQKFLPVRFSSHSGASENGLSTRQMNLIHQSSDRLSLVNFTIQKRMREIEENVGNISDTIREELGTLSKDHLFTIGEKDYYGIDVIQLIFSKIEKNKNSFWKKLWSKISFGIYKPARIKREDDIIPALLQDMHVSNVEKEALTKIVKDFGSQLVNLTLLEDTYYWSDGTSQVLTWSYGKLGKIVSQILAREL